MVFKTNYCLMQVKILLTFIKLPFVIKIFVLSIFEWSFYTGFTVISPEESLASMTLSVNSFICLQIFHVITSYPRLLGEFF